MRLSLSVTSRKFDLLWNVFANSLYRFPQQVSTSVFYQSVFYQKPFFPNPLYFILSQLALFKMNSLHANGDLWNVGIIVSHSVLEWSVLLYLTRCVIGCVHVHVPSAGFGWGTGMFSLCGSLNFHIWRMRPIEASELSCSPTLAQKRVWKYISVPNTDISVHILSS